MRSTCRTVVMAAIASGAVSFACSPAPAPVNEVVAVRVSALPGGPADAAWARAPEHAAKMILQDLVEPRLLKPSTAEVRVRALTDGARVAFRLEWADTTKSDMPGPAQMVDACAVQVPRVFDPQPPAPQMGEAGKVVDVAYWRADWQASVDGRGDTLRDLYPNSAVDHYPFDAQSLPKGSAEQAEMARRYAPARALGNVRSGPRSVPVEDLVAEGPGTLSPAPGRGSSGKGAWADGRWTVTITRVWPQGVADGQRTSIAFAAWQGSEGEAGSRKMRTGWIPLVAKVNR